MTEIRPPFTYDQILSKIQVLGRQHTSRLHFIRRLTILASTLEYTEEYNHFLTALEEVRPNIIPQFLTNFHKNLMSVLNIQV